jgi:hypothetical protein
MGTEDAECIAFLEPKALCPAGSDFVLAERKA